MLRLVVSLLFAIALAAGSAVKSHSGSGSIDGSCSTPNTRYLLDSVNCTVYYECHDGKPLAIVCPAQTRLNITQRACVRSDYFKCTRSRLTKSAKGECPAQQGGTPVYLPDSEKCSIFYECSNGEPVQQSCANGLYWNTALNTCDHAENVNCTAGEDTEGKSKVNKVRRWISQALKFFK